LVDRGTSGRSLFAPRPARISKWRCTISRRSQTSTSQLSGHTQGYEEQLVTFDQSL
jgi:hypothetical protein